MLMSRHSTGQRRRRAAQCLAVPCAPCTACSALECSNVHMLSRARMCIAGEPPGAQGAWRRRRARGQDVGARGGHHMHVHTCMACMCMMRILACALPRRRSSRRGSQHARARARVHGLDGCQVRITPALEWAHAFTDCWRLHRDCFYDPNMHGLGRRGWRAVHDRQACQQQHMSICA